MALGNLRKANAMQAADDFFDLVIGSILMTAVVLGQTEAIKSKTSRIRHSVETFLSIYAISGANRVEASASSIRK